MLYTNAIAVTSLFIVPGLTYLLMSWFKKRLSFEGQHIFITGGSQGIGLSLAHQLFTRGSNVTIVARTQSKLDEAVRQIETLKDTQRLAGSIQAIAADVTKFSEASCHLAFN